MLSGASIICLSTIDWDFNRQQPQELASALAQGGNRVLFVENTGIRRPTLRDASRLRARLTNWFRAGGGCKPVASGIDVFAPLLLPLPYSRLACVINGRILLPVLRGWRRREPGGPLIVITFLPTPLARAVIHALHPTLVVYYCIDRLTASSPQAQALRHHEPKVLAEADLVVVSSADLYARAEPLASRVELLSSGVHVTEFERARRSDSPPPAPFAGLHGPVIGFVGSLRRSTDLALLGKVADLASDLNFVLVGPALTDVRSLAARPNVRLVPAVPHAEVMRYMTHFDVGILPYVLDPFTAALMPVKLKEYLAAGLPIVSTALPEVRRFAQMHPGLVEFAADAPSFVAALRAAVADKEPAAVERRITVARQYDWRNQMAQLREWMERLLAERPGSRHESPGPRPSSRASRG